MQARDDVLADERRDGDLSVVVTTAEPLAASGENEAHFRLSAYATGRIVRGRRLGIRRGGGGESSLLVVVALSGMAVRQRTRKRPL